MRHRLCVAWRGVSKEGALFGICRTLMDDVRRGVMSGVLGGRAYDTISCVGELGKVGHFRELCM